MKAPHWINALSIAKTAITYWNAKKSGTCTFKYKDGHGCLKGNLSADLYDEHGNAIIDCSTFAGLVMRGINYLDSPYNESHQTTYNPRKIISQKDYAFSEPEFDFQKERTTETIHFPTYDYTTASGNYRIITASDIAFYYAQKELTWMNHNKTPQTGDLCFFYRLDKHGNLKYPNRYLGVSHVGIMLDDEYFLNATDYPSSGNLIRTSIHTRKPFLYARPDYNTFSRLQKSVNLLPNIWADIPQGRSIIDGRFFHLKANMLNVTTIISSKNTLQKYIIHPECPLTLPAGTYKLTGVVNNTDHNLSTNHSFFGMRIFDANRNPIPGFTTTADGKQVFYRTPVWDIGGGAKFVLSTRTRIIIELFLSPNKVFHELTISPVLRKTD